MAISEKIQLLGKDVYKGIPNELTLTAIPTASELDYVGAEDFDEVMLTKILPKCIEEDIDPKDLLEIDYLWVLRCLRFINYGPYTKVGLIVCQDCREISRGEYKVNLETVDVKPLPEGFVNSITISKDEFIDFNKDITFQLPTIREVQNARKDQQFKDAFGNTNEAFARLCYMIKSIGGLPCSPIDVRMELQKNLSSADYLILKGRATELEDYGLRAYGSIVCPKCGSHEAVFRIFINESFFRPDLESLREWKNSRDRREAEELSRTKTGSMRQNTR